MGDLREQETTGVDDFLLIHVPNFRTGRMYFGASDIGLVESLVATLNDRMTQTDSIMYRHSDPVMMIPSGVVDQQTGELDKDTLDFIERDNDEDKSPEYITWDGSLSENLQFMKELTDKILLISETDPSLLGLDTGGGPVSGRALKFSIMRTLAKVNRKRNYYANAIPKLLELAQRLEGIKDPAIPTIIWQDGLPQDKDALLDEVDRRLTNQTMDRKTAIERLDGVEAETAEDMLQAIDADDTAATERVRENIGTRERPNINVQVAGLEEE